MKNLKLLIILLVLSIIAYLIMEMPTLLTSDSKFAYSGINSINKIELSADSLSTQLMKKDDGWYADDIKANEAVIDNLLYALSHQQAAYPVPAGQIQKAREALAANGISVRAYKRNSVKLNFTICKFDTLCIALNAYKKQPYALSIPGTHDKTIDFLSANKMFYANNILFKYLPSEIESVTVENVDNAAQSFKIFRENSGKFLLFNLLKNDFEKNPSQEKIRIYLNYFNGVEFEKMEDFSSEEIKNISKNIKYKLSIKTKENEISVGIATIPLAKPRNEYGQQRTVDNHNFYLLLNNNTHVALAKWINFDILLKNLSDFVN